MLEQNVIISFNGGRKSYRVVRKTAKTMTVRENHNMLVNKPGSGEVDELTLKPTPEGWSFRPNMLVGDQRWVVTDNPDGEIKKLSLRDDGKWTVVGVRTNSMFSKLVLDKTTPKEIYWN